MIQLSPIQLIILIALFFFLGCKVGSSLKQLFIRNRLEDYEGKKWTEEFMRFVTEGRVPVDPKWQKCEKCGVWNPRQDK